MVKWAKLVGYRVLCEIFWGVGILIGESRNFHRGWKKAVLYTGERQIFVGVSSTAKNLAEEPIHRGCYTGVYQFDNVNFSVTVTFYQ